MNFDSEVVAQALARFENLHPKEIDLSLGRMAHALEKLGRPHRQLPPVIHVAGTNGKGSTCAFLRALLEAAGLKVHVFTSPHLVRFNERIRLAGKLIADDTLIDCLQRTFAALDGAPITHFEATTAAALLAFSETDANVLILEVGLGGRFDATNVIDQPAVSVITPVDRDHEQFLGSDLAGIAGEKAGIIKQGRPVVSAQQSAPCTPVIAAKAAACEAPLHVITAEDIARIPVGLQLSGRHQQANAALALCAAERFTGKTWTPDQIVTGLSAVNWPARLQRLKAGPLTSLSGGIPVWLDGGHNRHAGLAIARWMQGLPGSTVMICAMMASKDHAAYFETLKDRISNLYTVPNKSGHQGADPDVLAADACALGMKASSCESFQAALKAAAAQRPDQILIAGSLYLAGDVLARNEEWPD